MRISTQRLDYLLKAYNEGRISKPELSELFTAINDPLNAERIKTFLDERLQRQTSMESDETLQRAEAIDWDSIFRKAVKPLSEKEIAVAPSISITYKRRLLYAAAVVVAFAAGWYLLPQKKTERRFEPDIAHKIQVQAGGNKAVLTLADGSTITLDSVPNGELATQGAAKVMKLASGQIEYKQLKANPADKNKPVAYNTMRTPRGGQYQLTLPDGSKVWLNAASSITYPVSFSARERKVNITGEAYFEVIRNSKKQFIVSVDNQPDIVVLGTYFNVNSYLDGGAFKTSLMKGSVRIGDKILKPGHAYVNGKVMPTNIEQDIAWKNGFFNFNMVGLEEVMRQLSRWYDIEVIYAKEIPQTKFFGEMGRDLTLAQVIKGLEGSGVKFAIEGKKIIVNP